MQKISSARILVADDEVVVAMELSERLQDLGFEVVGEAYSGEQAMDMALEQQPDLALLDMVMPAEMDGVQAGQKIYEEMNIPVVYMTAHTEEENLCRLDNKVLFFCTQ